MRSEQLQSPFRKKILRWFKIGVLLSMIPLTILLSFVFLWIYVYIINGPIPPATLEDIFTCGDYRLLVYGYNNGDRYVQLVNKKNKVLDELSFPEPLPVGEVNWDEDCRSLNVGSVEYITKLRADK